MGIHLNFLDYCIKAYVVGTHLNRLDLLRSFKQVPTRYAFIKNQIKIHGCNPNAKECLTVRRGTCGN